MWINGMQPVETKKGDIVGYQGECDTPFVILSPNKNAKGRELPGEEKNLGSSPVAIPCIVENRQVICFNDGIRAAQLKLINGLWHYQRFGTNTPIVQLAPNTYFEIGGHEE